ncbi:MAG TPA: MlaD family protein [Oscillatoriaceae cyanobacterium]
MKNFNNEVMLGGFIVLAGGLLAYMAIAVGGFNFTPGVHVKADFTNATGLVKDAEVAIAGVQVGHVESLGVDGNLAAVKIFIDKDAQVREDVVAKIRAKSLLGEKYLELVPQSRTAPLLKSGDVIADTQADVEVDDLLAAMTPMLKHIDPQDVATIVHGVAKTMGSHGDDLATIVRNAAQISDQVHGLLARNDKHIDAVAANLDQMTADGSALLKAKGPEISSTVTHIDHLTGVLAQEGPGIVKDVHGITTTINAHAPKIANQIDHTLSQVPGTLQDVHATLGKVNPLLDKANAFNEDKMHKIAHDLFIKNGVRIFMYPFGPTEDPWKKKVQTDVAPPQPQKQEQ